MPGPTVNSLQAALDLTNSDVKSLREKVDKAEVWIKALSVVALVLGVAGGIGWYMLNTAQDQLAVLQRGVKQAKYDLSDFTVNKKKELAAEAAAAVASAVQANSADTRLRAAEIRLAQIGTGEGAINSGQPIGQIRHNMLAACPAGQVAKSVKLNLGGTCNSECNGDGQPVSQLELVCVKQ